jgi:ubiquitin carboxyl-terminal hydrolase 10
VHTIDDALARNSRLEQLGSSDSGAISKQESIEVLPPILTIHLRRFLYDSTTGAAVKIGKPVQFGPELDIPIGAIFSFVSVVLTKAKNPRLCVQKS